MDLPSPAGTEGRDRFGRFKRGVSGNPAGGKRTTKRLLTEKLDRMAEADAPRLYAKIVALADAGDLDALKFLVSRAWPARKGRPLSLSLPSDANPMAVLTAALQAVTAGLLMPEEAEAMARLVEASGKALDAQAIHRIEALDADRRALEDERQPRPRLAA